METRKIQSVGGGTYTVSLPRKWAESQGLDAGDVVNLHTHIDGVVAIQTEGEIDELPEEITVGVEHADAESLEQIVRAAYAAGASEVTLRSDEGFTSEQRRVVERTVQNLTGVSVVEERDGSIRLVTPLDPGEISVHQSVRQLRFVALSMHRDATAALTGAKPPESLAGRDEQADRLYALIERSFGRGLSRLDEVDALGVTRSELFELWLTTRELERVADHAEGLTTVAATTDARMTDTARERTAALAERAREVVADAVSVVVGDLDVGVAQRVLSDRDAVLAALDALEADSEPPANADLRYRLAYDRLRRTVEHGGNIAELALRRAIRRGELDVTADADDDIPAETDSPEASTPADADGETR
ncbi:phosphate uptake regulator PhoU [Halobellus ordinarius]|uniref:phosphate uptake regulator PhoU n=1 Tax=Halobellus ordinarius TaxID=3075120 RepID=UPI0028808361|nr:phosphate uptake regulator PhoU [Halobellus sp. ZY16]